MSSDACEAQRTFTGALTFAYTKGLETMSQSDNVKAIIADDHPLFRAALTQALAQSLPDYETLEAQSFQDVLDKLKQLPDIELIFLDLQMPGNDGFSGLTELRTTFPDILVVMVSANEDPKVIQKAINLGASGYIPKSSSLTGISEAVDAVLNGDIWVPAQIDLNQELPDDNPERQLAEKVERLTPAQFRVLQMISNGLLNKQIAYELDIQERTVKHHVAAIFEKLGVNNRTQAGVILQQLKQYEA